MGKPTGFMDYARRELAQRAPSERINDWQEIKTSSLPHREELRCQASRCMDCGVPFCHSGIMLNRMVSGCPLHNLMPEFNDLLYRGMDAFAYARLAKTNNFPEFTSHVCPAPCEGACNAGLASAPVTIKNIEQYIIENAFEQGLVQPGKPARRSGKRVAVVGSGPAGLACADQLNRAGHLVTVYERADRPGGLLMYGVPNMKLDKKLIARRVQLLQEAGITFALNAEVGVKLASSTLLEEYDAVVLCTGATVPRDLPVKGRELAGIYFAKEYLHGVTKSLLDSNFADGLAVDAKDKDVVIIGGGDTGNDCMATVIRQGCRSVRQLEINPCLPHCRAEDNPWPQFPRVFKTDYGQEEAICKFKEDAREFCVTTKEFIGETGHVTGLRLCQNQWQQVNGRRVPVDIAGTERVVPAQLVLLAMGFTGSEQRLLDEFGVAKAANGSIAADDKNYLTSVPGVFAAGDARRGQSLVVWAIAEGRGAAAAVDKYLAAQGE
ncbi:MAG: glutamate synthase subunit beta [Phascolarctobacterium sp.]|uniref:glutamate synthase subunit beta n=1 Tax=Phascolarctobacterium sp. TaxID=2049039 RepID=UPI0026DB9D9B|nr:glutamate synthase subunit beta [Phascolarctobacterium sp.]MDO4921465.1 glutamate synthase subunit beta [Phascolarctobacterium sp.]